VLTDQALRYGLDMNAPFVLLLLDNADRSSQKLLQQYRRANRLAGMHNWRGVVGQFAGRVVIIMQASEDVEAVARALVADSDDTIRIGISATHRGTEGVAAAHEQCLDAIRIMRRLKPAQTIIHFEELGYLYPLYRAGSDSLTSNPQVPGLRKLVHEHQADLFHTLEVYLDAGGNAVHTAKLLTIHRSTLNYRLSRIEEVCGVDLSDPTTRTNLQMALKLLRLFEVE
jgi:DNA-binding PucR family transcriptional regulator